MIAKPHVDWFALAPTLALLGASGLLLMAAVLLPAPARKPAGAFLAFAGFVAAGVWAGFLADRSPVATPSGGVAALARVWLRSASSRSRSLRASPLCFTSCVYCACIFDCVMIMSACIACISPVMAFCFASSAFSSSLAGSGV